MSRAAHIPPAAERLDAHRYYVAERKPSVLVPGAEQIEPRLRCPRCDRTRPLPNIDHTVNCAGCGLALCISGGLNLYIWECEPEPTS